MGTELVAKKLNQCTETALMAALVIAGVILIAIGLSGTSKWTKALVLAWIALP